LDAQGKSLPLHVHQEFDAYLKCGRLEHGFLRVRRDKYHFERLVAFSCKKRGFCPSCGARRMAETAALLADEVFPDVPLRQWVISFPFPLRYLFAAHPQAMAKVLVPPPTAKSDEILAASGGMFYARETPEHDVYVAEGDHFDAGDPLFIIEVMKMFNKYYAPFSGTVEKVLVESDGMIISKGQPIFKVTPDEKFVETDPKEIARQRREITSIALETVLP